LLGKTGEINLKFFSIAFSKIRLPFFLQMTHFQIYRGGVKNSAGPNFSGKNSYETWA